MQRLGRAEAHRLQVVRLQQVEHLEHRDPLPVRRQLPDIIAAIVRRDRLDPLAPVRGQVVGIEQAADPPGIGRDLLGDRPAIEGLAPPRGQQPQRARQAGIAEDLPLRRRLAARQEAGRRGRHLGQLAGGGLPVRRDDLADRETFLGIRDRRRQQLGQRLRAEPLAQHFPALDAAGHRPAQRTFGRDRLEAAGPQPLDRRRPRGAAAGVKAVELPRSGVPDEGEQIAPQPARHRLDDAQDGIGRQGRVDGVAAGAQHGQGGLGRQGLAGAGHPLPGQDGRARLVRRAGRPVVGRDAPGRQPAAQEHARQGDEREKDRQAEGHRCDLTGPTHAGPAGFSARRRPRRPLRPPRCASIHRRRAPRPPGRTAAGAGRPSRPGCTPRRTTRR